MSGEATDDERVELDHLLARDPEAIFYVELLTQLWEEEKIREIGSREVTDTDMAYLKHLARHRPKFASPSKTNSPADRPAPPKADQPVTPPSPKTGSPITPPSSSKVDASDTHSPAASHAIPPSKEIPDHPLPPVDTSDGVYTGSSLTSDPVTPASDASSPTPYFALSDASPTRRRKSHKVLLASWGLVGVVLTAGLFYSLSRHTRSSSAATDGNTEFSVALGARRQLTLPDGTKVWLNAGSRLSYDSDMLRKDIRAVTLSGEAFFDVAKDKNHCFIIHTDKIAIRVLGTAFNVKAYPRDKITETTLLQGSVELTVNKRPYQKIILKPKEKFALLDNAPDNIADGSPDSAARGVSGDAATDSASARSGRTPGVHPANKETLVIQDVVPIEVDDKEYVKEVSWVEDNFVFQNETLEELAPKMERWFNVQIKIDNARIGALHFSGIFHKETIGQALSALQFIQPFKFKITDNHVYIN